jgi:hypothetical protein
MPYGPCVRVQEHGVGGGIATRTRGYRPKDRKFHESCKFRLVKQAQIMLE